MTRKTPRAKASVCAPLTLAALLTLGALSGCKKLDCAPLCKRVRQCEAQVTRALVERQPSKSRFMKHVRKRMPADLVPRLIKSCPERCEALGRSKKWKKKLKACAALKECEAFARCIAPALEP